MINNEEKRKLNHLISKKLNPKLHLSPERKSALNRNLFGVRLDHEQLRHDLNELKREHIEAMSQKWSFNFETFEPLKAVNSNLNYEWVSTRADNINKFSKSFDAGLSDDDQENDGVRDTPRFYKQQRVTKLSDAKTRSVSLSPVKARKLKPIKHRNDTALAQDLMITTASDERKDTLRSGQCLSMGVKDNFKQQTLLDLFKQRKRRNVGNDDNQTSSKTVCGLNDHRFSSNLCK